MPAFWGVVRSLPKREAFAAERCADGGFEVFLPLVQTQRASAPLFRGYFFCRIVDRWRSINSTFGVLCLVRVGDCPAKCPDYEIDSLKTMIDERGFVRLPEGPGSPVKRKIAIGSKVKITAGPFGGMSGLYAGMSTKDCEKILLKSSWQSEAGARPLQPGHSGAVEGRGHGSGGACHIARGGIRARSRSRHRERGRGRAGARTATHRARARRTIAVGQAALMLRAAGDDRRRGPAIWVGPEGLSRRLESRVRGVRSPSAARGTRVSAPADLARAEREEILLTTTFCSDFTERFIRLFDQFHEIG